jgi:phosphatidate cytidylyltransferase
LVKTEQQSTGSTSALRDLGPRLASGLVLAAVAALLTWHSVASFAALVLAVGLIVAWEWGRVVRGAATDAIFALHAASVVAALVATYAGWPALALGVVLLVSATTYVLARGARGIECALGVLYSGLPTIALVWFRSSPQSGFAAAMFLLLIVWTTDTCAYAAGRLIGGPRLMPSVSPNKTWSGLAGGVTAAMVMAGVFELVARGSISGRLILSAGLLAIVAQAGDLAESALKRQHAIKDASGLIPGHGGFMDRVDGLIVAAVAAALYAVLVDPAVPARALLGWRGV